VTLVTDTLSYPLYYLGIQILNIYHFIVFFLGGGGVVALFTCCSAPF